MATMSDSTSPLKRQTSPSTGLSYLSNHQPTTTHHRRLYIFIHGWACTAQDFTPLIFALSASTLSRETLFIVPDLPGHGHSPQSICPHPTVSAFARLINDLCDELLLLPTFEDVPVPTTVVGHSMGCRITLELFSQTPVTTASNITSLVLLDGSWYGREPKDYKPISGNDAEELQNVLDVFDTMLGVSTPAAFRQQIRQHVRQMDLDYANELRRDYIAWDGRRMEETLTMVGGTGNGSDGQAVRVLVVQGTEGHGAKRKSLKKGGYNGPWMQLVEVLVGDAYHGVVVEDSGHWPHVDRVEEVAHAIEVFDDLSSTPAVTKLTYRQPLKHLGLIQGATV